MIELWLSFISSLVTFTPFISIMVILAVVSCVLLIRSFNLW